MVEYIGGPVDGRQRVLDEHPLRGQLSLFVLDSGCPRYAYCYQYDGFHYVFTGYMNESQVEELLAGGTPPLTDYRVWDTE